MFDCQAVEKNPVNERAAYFPALIEELMAFPASRNDDQVDCLALIGQLLAEMLPGNRKPRSPDEYDPDRDPYAEHTGQRDDTTDLQTL